MWINKSVYLLGAGASAASDFRLPTMAGLIEDTSFSGSKRLSEFTSKYFPKKTPHEIDIEELITYLDFIDAKYSVFGDAPNPDIWHVKNELFIYLRKRLTDQSGKEYCDKFKRLFAGHSKGDCRDSIITLNYDLVMDMTLASLAEKNDIGGLSHDSLLDRMYHFIQEINYMDGAPFSLEPDPAYYLKLHGSLDWYYCSNIACKNHLYFFANKMQSKWPQVSENDICQLCGARAEPVIVPPNINKSFAKFPKLSFIWNLAYREIQASDALVVIGLSFRNTDYYLRWLVKSSLLNVNRSIRTFELVDTDENMCDVLANVVGIKPDEIRYFKSLPEYIDMVEQERLGGRRA